MNERTGWTLPNTITSARLGIAGILFLLLALEPEVPDPLGEGGVRWSLLVALVIFCIAAVSDAVDGWYARRYGLTSAFGRVADPFVDKILVCGTFIFLTANEASRVFIPAWFVVIVVGREFLVTGIRGFVESCGQNFPADRMGKVKMIVQCLAIAWILFRFSIHEQPSALDGSPTCIISQVCVWLTLILTVVSGAQYVYKARKQLFA